MFTFKCRNINFFQSITIGNLYGESEAEIYLFMGEAIVNHCTQQIEEEDEVWQATFSSTRIHSSTKRSYISNWEFREVNWVASGFEYLKANAGDFKDVFEVWWMNLEILYSTASLCKLWIISVV